MILVPAIDILGGKAVRLRQGSFAEPTLYDADPLVAARRWVEEGAQALHVVDLDGARVGKPVNVDHVRRIAEAVDVPVQVGGGLRTMQALSQTIAAGAARVVMGTAALSDPALVERAVSKLGDRLVVSIDARSGRVAASGWTDELDLQAVTALAELYGQGVRRFVYSSIEHDGTLCGPDLNAVSVVADATAGSFLYSGGISSLEDLDAIAALRARGLTGVIVGKALYERRFTVAQGQARLEQACTTSG